MTEDCDDLDIQTINDYLTGDARGFNILVDRYQRPIYNLAYRFSGNSDDARDLTQEIFIHLYRKLGSFRGESTFSTWFYRLAVNYCKDWLGKKSRRINASDPLDIIESTIPDSNDGPGQAYEKLETQKAVQGAISQLSKNQKLVVILHDIQGYDYETIAKMIESPVGTVKSRLARGRQKLAEKLISYGNES
jgi:RNA polymerase sigma-70 factor, ECF subfamily